MPETQHEPRPKNPHEPAQEARRPRFQLRSLLFVVCLVGVGAAWWADRMRLEGRVQQAENTSRIAQRQVESLQKRLALRQTGVQFIYYWRSADEFLEMLVDTDDDDQFLMRAPSLAQADPAVFDPAVQGVIGLLESNEERTRSRALNSLRFLQEAAPERMAEHVPLIVPRLIALMGGESELNVAEAIYTAGALGPAAGTSAEALRLRMQDDEDWFAPDAAQALAKVEPSAREEVATRLIELIERNHPNWYSAAFRLPEYAAPARARAVLEKRFAAAETEAERNQLVAAMNQIRPADAPAESDSE